MPKLKLYPTDVSDEEWYFAASYLGLMSKDAPQRRYELREMFNALRWIVRAGAPWRSILRGTTRWFGWYVRGSPLHRPHGDAGHDAPLEHDVKHHDRRRGEYETRAQQRNVRRIFAAQCGDTDH